MLSRWAHVKEFLVTFLKLITTDIECYWFFILKCNDMPCNSQLDAQNYNCWVHSMHGVSIRCSSKKNRFTLTVWNHLGKTQCLKVVKWATLGFIWFFFGRVDEFQLLNASNNLHASAYTIQLCLFYLITSLHRMNQDVAYGQRHHTLLTINAFESVGTVS